MKDFHIYLLGVYTEDGNYLRQYQYPDFLKKLSYSTSKVWYTDLLINKYFSCNPNKLQNEQLEIASEKSKKTLAVEPISPQLWCANEAFYNFCLQKNLNFEFFPIQANNDLRYLTMWRKIPVITDYELDVSKCRYNENSSSIKGFLEIETTVFRSDILEHYSYPLFCNINHVYLFADNTIKEEFEKNNFLFNYSAFKASQNEVPTTQIPLSKKTIDEVLLNARQKERILLLTDIRKQKLQDVDDYLEKILTEENDTIGLEKFHEEIKGNWKKDFERYEQNLMEPLDKITYW